MQRREDDILRNELLDKNTTRHYMHILMNTYFTYERGESRLTDKVYMRLRFKCKYYWEPGGVSQTEKESKCRVCGAPKSHYVMTCPLVERFRNAEFAIIIK